MSAHRIATLDVGTNTILALVATVDAGATVAAGRVTRERDEMDIVRLGEGLDRSGELSEAAMERALGVLARHGEALARERPERVAAVATEAVRKARNGSAFLGRATAALGHPLVAIDGEREAALSFLATARSLPAPATGPRVVIDIGGGSTEIIVGDAADPTRIARATSIAIGSVRLTERLIASDPPSEGDRARLVETVDAALDAAPFPLASVGARELVGIAGTVTTLYAIHRALDAWDADAAHGARMHASEVDALVARLGALDAAARRRLPGLDPRRADLIYAGGVILARALARLGAVDLVVSDRGIRWGLAYQLADALAAAR